MSWGMRVGLGLFGLFVFAAVCGPALAPQAPDVQDLDSVLALPDATHLLGTDENGSDVLSMVLSGARLALGIAGTTVLLSLTLGAVVGATAGTLGGWVDATVMRIVDILLSFPGILLNLAIVALVSRPGPALVVAALVANGWVGYARVARGQALSLRQRAFVQAARAHGASQVRVIAYHILPNLMGPLIVQATFGVGAVVMIEASLSFLGLGAAVPYSWGALLGQGSTYLWRTTHLVAAPGLAIATVVLGCNLLGDALRDRLDPRFVRKP